MPRLEVENFSKGKTDKYLKDVSFAYAEVVKNLRCDEEAKLEIRDGFKVFENDQGTSVEGRAVSANIGGAYFFDDTIFVVSEDDVYYCEEDDTSWTSFTSIFDNSTLNTGGYHFREYSGHLIITSHKGIYAPLVLFRNTSSAWTYHHLGLPATGSTTSTGRSAVGGNNSYIIVGVIKREYTAEVDGQDVTFTDYAKPTFYQESSLSIDPGTDDYTTRRFSWGFLDLHWASGSNYTNYYIEYYRTIANGTTLYYDGQYQITTVSGTHNYTFSDSDSTLSANKTLYTTGGVAENAAAIGCQYFDYKNGFGYLGYRYSENSPDYVPSRLYQTKPGNPNHIMETAYYDAPEVLTGVVVVGRFPLVFLASGKTERVEGQFDEFGRGFMRGVTISETEGCVSQGSIVRFEKYAIWASENGVCWSDGSRVVNLTSAHLRTTWRNLTNKAQIQGVYDAKSRRIFWGVQNPAWSSGAHSNANNGFLVLDLDWTSIEPGGGAIFEDTASDDLQPQAPFYRNNEVHWGDARGYVMQFEEDLTTDVVVDTGVANERNWDTQAIDWQYISVAYRMQSSATKWCSRFQVWFRNLSTFFGVGVKTYVDDRPTAGTMLSLQYDPDLSGAEAGIIKLKNHFPRGYLRSNQRQVVLEAGDVWLRSSDQDGTCTTDNGLSTAELDAGSWDRDFVGAKIYFADDSYTTGFTIDVQSGSTLTLASAPASLTNTAWQIKGKDKTQRVSIDRYMIDYEIIGSNVDGYESGDDSTNQ